MRPTYTSLSLPFTSTCQKPSAMYALGMRTTWRSVSRPLAVRVYSTSKSHTLSTTHSSLGKPVTLYTANTPNGQVVPVFMEELKEVYGFSAPDYEYVLFCLYIILVPAAASDNLTERRLYSLVYMSTKDADIGKVYNQVKASWFIEQVNPNGRIPAVVHKEHRVFETSAILVYLAQMFDKERKLSQDPSKNLSAWAEEQSWLFFAVCQIYTVSEFGTNWWPIASTAWWYRANARPSRSLQRVCEG
jgi:glutathione S-transferase